MSTDVTTPFGPVKTTTLYAVVDDQGNLLRGVGAVSARLDGNQSRTYVVTFNVDVSLGCYHVTTSGRSGQQVLSSAELPSGGGRNNEIQVRFFRNFEANPNVLQSGQIFFLTVTTAYGATGMT